MKYDFLDRLFFQNLKNSRNKEPKDFDLILQYLINNEFYSKLFPLNKRWFYLDYDLKIPTVFKKHNELEFDIPIKCNEKIIINIIECKNFSYGMGKNWIANLKKEGIDKFEFQVKALSKIISKKYTNIEFLNFFCYIDCNDKIHVEVYNFINNQFNILDKEQINLLVNKNNYLMELDLDISKTFYIAYKSFNPKDKLLELIKKQDFDSNVFDDNFAKIISNIFNKKNKKIIKISGQSGTGKTYLAIMLYMYFCNKKNYNIIYLFLNSSFGKLMKKELSKINGIPEDIKDNFFYETHSIKEYLKSKFNPNLNNIIIMDEFQRLHISSKIDEDLYLIQSELDTIFKNCDIILCLDENQKLNPKSDDFYFNLYLLNINREIEDIKLVDNFRIGNEHEKFLHCMCLEQSPFQNNSFLAKLSRLDKECLTDIKIILFAKTYNFHITNNEQVFF